MASTHGFPNSAIVVLNVPALSTVGKDAFEQQVKRTFQNPIEAAALVDALMSLCPVIRSDGARPTLAVLSPYAGQVRHLERLINPLIDRDGTLLGFGCARSGGKFVHTSDSFQGGEADVVLASLVRNNVLVGPRALGFVKNPQRINVLLSRAKQKLVLVTSLQFLREAVDGVDPDRLGGELQFLREIDRVILRLCDEDLDDGSKRASIIDLDENGKVAK